MKLCCIAFTEAGLQIASKIANNSSFEVEIFNKLNYKEHLNRIFETNKRIVFISSTGIAVRLAAPYLIDKTVDPAIVVIDDLGRYVISLISGHLGGANELAAELSQLLECQAIITTASDGRNIEAVDMFAKRNNLLIDSMEAAKKITAMMLEGKKLRLVSEPPLTLSYKHLSSEEYEASIYVTSKQDVSDTLPYCILRPQNINIGLGCRRGKTKAEILDAIEQVCISNNICMKSIKTVATVDVKSHEEGILEACEELECPVTIFDRNAIAEVEHLFAPSEFVKSQIGVTSVCEPCAYLAGGEIIVPKTTVNGITVAVSKEV